MHRGWLLFTQYAWGFLGFCLLEVVIISFISLVLGFILAPIVSDILGAGYFFVAFKLAKGQQVKFSDFFQGFSNRYFTPLFLANLVMSTILGLLGGASIVSFFIGSYNRLRQIFNHLPNRGDYTEITRLPELPIPPTAAPVFLILGLLFLLPLIYFSVAYAFAIPLIVERKLGFWDAMETSRRLITRKWFAFFGFSIILGLINLLGFSLGGIGLILTLPLSMTAMAAAYEYIVGFAKHDSQLSSQDKPW
jgi:hypothetical protein